MKNFSLGFLLHMYQPPWQTEEVMRTVVEECYRPLFRFLINWDKGFAFTLNVNYSVIELLQKYGHDDVVRDIKICLEKGIIELVYSTCYHPIVPLIQKFFVKYQIHKDTLFKKRIGIEPNSLGFFFPEMAFDTDSLVFLKKKTKVNWTLVQDVAVEKDQIPYNYINSYKGMLIFLRSSRWSKFIWDDHLTFEQFSEKLEYEWPSWTGNNDSYLILSMDIETFGHHVPDLYYFLTEIIGKWGTNDVGIISPFEKIKSKFLAREIQNLKNSSWSTTNDHINNNNPFPLWNDQNNRYHKDLWNLVNVVIKFIFDSTINDLTFDKRNEHLFLSKDKIVDIMKIQSSCYWWWVGGGRKEVGLMKIGANMCKDFIEKYGSSADVKKAKEIYDRLVA